MITVLAVATTSGAEHAGFCTERISIGVAHREQAKGSTRLRVWHRSNYSSENSRRETHHDFSFKSQFRCVEYLGMEIICPHHPFRMSGWLRHYLPTTCLRKRCPQAGSCGKVCRICISARAPPFRGCSRTGSPWATVVLQHDSSLAGKNLLSEKWVARGFRQCTRILERSNNS